MIFIQQVHTPYQHTMFRRLPIIAIFFTLVVFAQTAPSKPERILRSIIRKMSELTDVEKENLFPNVQQYPDKCLLSMFLLQQNDDSRLLVAIATSTEKSQKEAAYNLIKELIETKVNALLCDSIIDQLGLNTARRPRYDRVMGMMLIYDFSPDDNFPNRFIKETICDEQSVFIAKLNENDILELFHKQQDDPTDSRFNRNRLRNAIVKQMTREMLGWLQQGKTNKDRFDDVQNCLKEINKIQETQIKKHPDDDPTVFSQIAPFVNVANYCHLVSIASSDRKPIDDVFFWLAKWLDENSLPTPWYDIFMDYAATYRPDDYAYLKNKRSELTPNNFQ